MGTRAPGGALLLLLLCGDCVLTGGCDESRMLDLLTRCGDAFAARMHKVEVKKWCDLSEFIVYYDRFTNCSEVKANLVGCHWPNPLAQSFLSSMHQRFFSNCSLDRTQWEDPPEEVLVPLIALPVLLTVAMAGLVMWRSKHSDPQS